MEGGDVKRGLVGDICLAIYALEEQIQNIYKQCGVRRVTADNQEAARSLMRIMKEAKELLNGEESS